MEDHLIQNQGKSSGTNRCLLALLSLVAIAGVGIGVFSVVHSSSLQSDIDELQSQLKALQKNTPASNATVAKLVAEVQAVEASISSLQSGVSSINQFLGDDSVVATLQCLDDTTKLAYASDGMAVAKCPANCDASVSASHLWGTHIYSASSSICLAAVHDGELHLSAGGFVRVIQLPGEDRYTGSTQHGVKSSDKGASESSFRIGTTLRQNVSNNLLPPGSIVAFSGTLPVPAGWVVCDGDSGTPDLKGRFLLGESSTHPVASVGGAETHKLTEAEMPAHTHQYQHFNLESREEKYGGGKYTRLPPALISATSESAGGDQEHNNMPPFFVVQYIMKL